MCWFAALGAALGASASTATVTGAAATMAAASMVGAGVSAYASYKSGESTKKAGEYNAEMQRRQAQEALQIGAIDAANKQDKARRLASTQAEGTAMSGVALDTGTPLDLLTETAGLGELDALRTINNARRSAWGMGAQAELDEFQGRSAGRGGVLNAAGTFLGGASNAYFGYRSAVGSKA